MTYLKPNEAARILRISVQRIKKFIANGELPAITFSDGTVRIREEDLHSLGRETVDSPESVQVPA